MFLLTVKHKGVRRIFQVDDDFTYAGGYFEMTNTGHIRYWNPRTNKRILLHRLIMNAKQGQYIDHINGDRADNRKCNLRFASLAQNQFNRKLGKDNTSGFKGVSMRGPNRWEAGIKKNRKTTYLGIFKTPEEAHLAYVKAAHEMFGEFANDGKYNLQQGTKIND